MTHHHEVMQPLTLADLHHRALLADVDYQRELIRTWGERDASDARYDARGVSTANLRALADAKVQAYETFAFHAFPHRR